MNKIIFSVNIQGDFLLYGASVSDIISLSDKLTVKGVRKSRFLIINDAEKGKLDNYRLALELKIRNILITIQTYPIDYNQIKEYGFEPIEDIEELEKRGKIYAKLKGK